MPAHDLQPHPEKTGAPVLSAGHKHLELWSRKLLFTVTALLSCGLIRAGGLGKGGPAGRGRGGSSTSLDPHPCPLLSILPLH